MIGLPIYILSIFSLKDFYLCEGYVSHFRRGGAIIFAPGGDLYAQHPNQTLSNEDYCGINNLG